MWDLDTLLAQQTTINTLLIHSHDMGLYTVEAEIGGERRPLAQNGRSLSFRSIEHTRERLANLAVERCLLVQYSPYQEMIGQSGQTALPMELELSWPGWQREG